MGRDKRKSRLDKGGATGGEFVGFSAFAAPSTSLKASPVYTGSDAQLSLVFKRITQKRDAVTKARALNELQAYFEQQHSRKEQVDALSYLVYVYQSKINYDDASSVRAAALSSMNAAYQRLPKAWHTLVMEQQPEVCGMMWCARADPAAEVRAAAECYGGFSQKGVIEYVTRILGYGRPRSMHDALFARKQETDPPDRDELDERYERILGTALGGMDLWMQAQPETINNSYDDAIKDGILWSPLNSSKSSLRRKTYSLLATLCQHAKSLVYGEEGLSTLPKLLTNALVQEKDAVNIPSLLEILLLYLNNFPDGDPWKFVDAPLFVKGLGKQLKKACHGASVSQWGPTMLPLLASISDGTFALQLQLLNNMSTGMEAAISPRESVLIAEAIAECSSFFLLRRESETEQMDTNTAKQFSEFWLQVLAQYLSVEVKTSMAKAADESLLHAMSESFFKLDDSSYNRPHSAIYRIKDWFWNEAMENTVMNAKEPSNDGRWAELLKNVMEKRQREKVKRSHADELVQKYFHLTLSLYQGDSREFPTSQAYDLMTVSLKYCGARYIFAEDSDDRTTLERYLMNDLLRWIVVDTSLSTSPKRQVFVRQDFLLLRECLLSVSSPLKQKSVWETILKEAIAADCDLELLSEGLIVLMQEPEMVEVLHCEELNAFAIKVGKETVSRYQHHYFEEFIDEIEDKTYNDGARKASIFLKTCVGLTPGSSTPLVRQRVIHQWAEDAVPESEEHVFELGGDADIQNPLAATLLSLVARGDVSLLSSDDADRIVLESWRRGGKQWNEEAVPLLLNQGATPERQHICSVKHIIESGTRELQELLISFCRLSDNDLVHVALVCHVWSERAFRILRLCSETVTMFADDGFLKPSLSMIGLADVKTWISSLKGDISVTHLYLCLVYTLQQFDSKTDRLELVLRSSAFSPTLLYSILLAISDATNGIVVDPVMRRDNRCAFLLSLLGGTDVSNELRQSWCKDAIAALSVDMKGDASIENSDRVTRGLSVLSELMFNLFGRLAVDERLRASDADVVEAGDVREGCELWYVSDDDGQRTKVRVMKVHSDDYPRLYFTIRIDGSDGVQERQTVTERLRMLPQAPDTCGDAVISSHLTEDERAERVKYGDMIYEELVQPVLAPVPKGEETFFLGPSAECVNIVIAHCGVLGKEGLATTRYEIFRLLSSLQSHVAQAILLHGRSSSVSRALRVLALAMGFGNIVPASKNNFRLMKFSPDESIKAILHYYGNEDIDIDATQTVDRRTLEWLTVGVDAVEDRNLCSDVFKLLFRLASNLVFQERSSARDEVADSVLVMRAVQNVEKARVRVKDDGSSGSDDEMRIITKLIEAFAFDWQTESDTVCQYQVLDVSKRASIRTPEWYEPFQSLLTTLLKQQRTLVAAAAKSSCDTLVENLFCPKKRWLALRLLDACANGEPFRLDPYIGDDTQQRLREWQEGLVDEEAEELADDVAFVGQWIPETIMNELESWKDTDEKDEADEVIAMGRMLSWLSFLSFVDNAAAVDVRFRGSVSAYLDYVDVKSVLGIALSYLNLEKVRNSKNNTVLAMQDVLEDRATLEFSKIAGLVMFRTVQAFPTHFKYWWEDDCPKNRSAAVSQYVETMIAPEVLRRELNRINNATDMGDMTVSGSSVSREVTATYTQDECQLSIAIQIPPNFPLRNVEVDGRLTLGIPEKRWKRWALQIRQMLNNQDGTLLDALLLWKENVDKDFAGLEPCPVCYSILSVKTHELPNLECNTCNNCFHSSCLYKWFHSSGKSQCVLCQQPWSGSRIERGG